MGEGRGRGRGGGGAAAKERGEEESLFIPQVDPWSLEVVGESLCV